MQKYYFYTLNEVRYPEKVNNYFQKLNREEDKYLQEGDYMLYALCNEERSNLRKHSERYELQNGQDARFLTHYGLKEISEENYNTIKTDDQRIVEKFNDKAKTLLIEYGHRTDGWHFPIIIEAEDRSHLRWLLRNTYPNYEINYKES